MCTRILVPVDGEPATAQALDVAQRLAARLPCATLLLLRMAPVREPAGGRARSAGATAAGIVSSEIVLGDASGAQVAEELNDNPADLIILPGEAAWAERAEHILHAWAAPHASVLLLPAADAALAACAPFEPSTALVIVPLDGSAAAEQALPGALALARAFGRVLVLLRAVPRPQATEAPPPGERLTRMLTWEHERLALAYLGAVRHRLAIESDVQVQTMVALGSPDAEAARLVEAHPGSVLVRTRAHADLAAPDAQAEERHTHVPVLLVPAARWG